MNQRLLPKQRRGEQALGPLCFPLGSVYSGTNKEEEAFAWLSGARRSTFTVLSHSPNQACFNMTLAMEQHFNGTENINRISQAGIQMQQHKSKEKHTHIKGFQ